MAMTVETAQLNNQSILHNFGLVEEIDEQAAEIISGGREKFRIANNTQYRITHNLDGTLFTIQPGETWDYDTPYNGIIQFDIDGRDYVTVNQSYNLSNGQIYEFQNNEYTANPYDIDLYQV
ncbi:hypothetical protein H1Q63_29095 [Desmonostoc muscorum CCALA 125]|uniref:Uncharacterized protein n=1 Tax=Desmonostoc muscorum LEGE 12446 TaxID=1828758 RepID=A0A8J7A2W4_DESMC|nr:hypothetical protein [Desmonostoc muscorum]MBX9257935.1 hypothetical protein [Desmonostoc muscorum CCALA 125]MCF2151195.1 hypothetical protein [Desmonostoc muscorum LEGE 12446]